MKPPCCPEQPTRSCSRRSNWLREHPGSPSKHPVRSSLPAETVVWSFLVVFGHHHWSTITPPHASSDKCGSLLRNSFFLDEISFRAVQAMLQTERGSKAHRESPIMMYSYTSPSSDLSGGNTLEFHRKKEIEILAFSFLNRNNIIGNTQW